jgi:starvation-inducible DNA-binding protein
MPNPLLKILYHMESQCAKSVRKGIADKGGMGDADSADLLTAISRDLDSALWMLEAHTRK